MKKICVICSEPSRYTLDRGLPTAVKLCKACFMEGEYWKHPTPDFSHLEEEE